MEKILKIFLENISTIIAVVAAIFAFSQARSAKKSLKLQEKIYSAGMANFKIKEISESFLYNDEKSKNVYYFFKVNLDNLSDKNTAINKVKLNLIGRENNFIVNYKEGVPIENDLVRLTLPCNIQAHSSANGWIAFEVPKNVYKELDIDTHFIIFEDIHGLEKKVEEIFISEKVVRYVD
ncbi:hypothetical protein N2W49_000937 [Clostridium perfringens]|uniref:DUF4352 domain-containing protein n=1 Tax=Clostridium perfringens TaxID=1502 RepID=UPI001E0FE4B5|nr:hypothetical protein [Clostridium perfringens]EHR0218357.1 hypothetical protein [Clostridium perfringens]EJT6158549.1 hypothetical protein [Clostridium perfringens]MDG6893881.1 hypothetical protein [Clostridium perfringens]MDM0782239.1 hypothetical protein [Clostridium perfringens]MDM0863736.1 hypothetical protein [Clostridium perfringens]